MSWKIHTAEFVTSAVEPEGYPRADRPEIAFGGRSNVGKSSLINSLVQRKKLVKTSKRPGRTQLINFFNINNELYAVDLPGYGFAKVPEEVKDDWGPMIEGYLSSRSTLKALVVVMDLRRGVEEDDFELIMATPHLGVQPVLVFTKADKFSPNQRKQRRRELAKDIETDPGQLILYSSTKGFGRKKLWKRLRYLAGI